MPKLCTAGSWAGTRSGASARFTAASISSSALRVEVGFRGLRRSMSTEPWVWDQLGFRA